MATTFKIENFLFESVDDGNLGKGSFGHVIKVRHKLDQQIYAMKKISITLLLANAMLDENNLQKLLDEVQLQSQINNENVVKYITSWMEGDNVKENKVVDFPKLLENSSNCVPTDFLYIVLELCDTDLRSWLKKNQTLEKRQNECDLNNALQQLTNGLKALHDLNIIHRDIKPENILIKNQTWKIGDLGLSRQINPTDIATSVLRGNLAYRAIELQSCELVVPSKSADVFSLGLIFVEILQPFTTDSAKYKAFFHITEDDKPNNAINKLLKDSFPIEGEVIKKMLVRDPNKRANIAQVLDCFKMQKNPQQIKVKSKPKDNTKIQPIKTKLPPNPYNRPIHYKIVPPVTTFSGRKGELHEISNGFRKQDQNLIRNIFVIQGLGGVGKTNLARKFAQLFSEQCGGDVIWIGAENSTALTNSFSNFFEKKLKLSWDSERKDESLKKFYEIFKEDTGRPPKPGQEQNKNSIILKLCEFPTLIIFDNAETFKSTKSFEIRDCLPHFHEFYGCSGTFKIPYFLITTRKKDLIAHSRILNLKPLRTVEAVEFVQKTLLETDPDEAKLLCEALQNFPLALQQAVAYIKEMEGFNYKIRDYVRDFEKKREIAKKLLQYEFTENSDDDYELTTYTVWNITLEKIKQLDQTSIDVLSILSYLPADNVTCEFLKDYLNFCGKFEDASALNSILLLPSKYSMYTLSKNTISVHRLVQKVTRLTLTETGQDEILLSNLMKFIRDSILEKGELEYYLELDDNFGISFSTHPCDNYFDHINSIWEYAMEKPNLLKEFYPFVFKLRKKLSRPPKTDEKHTLSNTLFKIQKTFANPEPETCAQAMKTFYSNMNVYTAFWHDENIRLWELLDMHWLSSFYPLSDITLKFKEDNLQFLTNQKKHDVALPLYKLEYESRCQTFGKESEQAFRILKGFAKAQGETDIDNGFQLYMEVIDQAKVKGDVILIKGCQEDLIHFIRSGVELNHEGRKSGGDKYFHVTREICREVYENDKKAMEIGSCEMQSGLHLIWFWEREENKLIRCENIVRVCQEMIGLYKKFGIAGFDFLENKAQEEVILLAQEHIKALFKSAAPIEESKKAKQIVNTLLQTYDYK